RRACVTNRQVQRERAAHTRGAAQLDLTTKQTCQLSTDRQSQTRAAVLAARARVGLLERLEHDALLLRRNADAGIGYLERDDATTQAEHRVRRRPPASGRRHVETHTALRREFERVRQQVLQHLLKTLDIRHETSTEPG